MSKNKGQWKPGTSGNPSGVSKAIAATRTDGWASALTGIGSSGYDKRMSHRFQALQLSYQELIDMWRADDLACRAIEEPVKAAFRQGYELVISDEGKHDKLKEDIEERLNELEVDKILQRAFAMERALGGCAILLGVDDGEELKTPLKLDRVTGIEWLTVVEPIEIEPARFYEDPANKKYGEPEYYQLRAYQAPGTGMVSIDQGRLTPPNSQYIHESRLIVFGGIRVSRYQTDTRDIGQYWGDSILVRLVEVLRDFNLAWQSAGIIVSDFSQAVYSMENLMQLVAKSPDKFRARMHALELGRSTARAVVIDAKEKFERKSTTVTGLSDLLQQLSLRLAAAIDMPLSLLMGQAPQGLGADSEGDLRLYYDKVRSFQRCEVLPILKLIISMVMKSMRQRGNPKKWTVRFNPLWQLTDAEIAEARLTQARTDSMYIKAGAVTPDEIRKSRFKGDYSYETQIEEHKEAPGFLVPLPAGVQPGTSVGGGLTSHTVGGYQRRNPTQKGLGPNTSEGGDNTPKDSTDRNEGYHSPGWRSDAWLEKRDDKWYVVDDVGDVGEFDTRDEALSVLQST